MTGRLIEQVTSHLRLDNNVRGILLTGSRARGDAYPHSDPDLLVLVTSCAGPLFSSETVGGMLVEQHVRGLEEAKARLLERSLELHSYLDGCAVYDPDGLLAELTRVAKDRFVSYRTPAHEKSAIFDWLRSVRLKLSAATDAGDLQKLGHHSSLNSWKVLEGLWALNDKPTPPAGAVWAHLRDLKRRPEGLERSLRGLFEGDTAQRAKSMLELIDWLLEHDEGSDEAP